MSESNPNPQDDESAKKKRLEGFFNHSNLVLALARKSGLSEDDAQKVVKEVIVKVAATMDNFDTARGSKQSWLLQLARHCIMDKLRRKP